MVKYILERLKEKSTYAGLLAVASAAGLQLAPELSTNIIAVVSAAAGLLLVLMKEKDG
jgi:hypothetical protein